MYNILAEYHVNMIFRMLVSCLCGMIIGFERENRAKEAGIRTHCIVACASAMMITFASPPEPIVTCWFDGVNVCII